MAVAICLQHLGQLLRALLCKALPSKIIGKRLIFQEFRLKNTGLHGEDDVAERLAQEFCEISGPSCRSHEPSPCPWNAGRT